MRKLLKKFGVIFLTCLILCNASCSKIPKQIIESLINEEGQQEETGTIIRYIPDTRPDAKDDFYANINYDVLTNQKIPSGNGCWCVLGDVSTVIAIDLYRLTLDLEQNQGNYEKGTPEQKISDFSALITDYDGRNEKSIDEINKALAGIRSASNLEEYIRETGALFTSYGFSSTIYFGIAADLTDSMKNTCWLGCPDIVLDKEIFTEQDMEEVRKGYQNYIKDMFVAYGYTEEEAASKMEGVYEMQYAIAEQSLSMEEKGNPEKAYNPYTREKLDELFPYADVDFILQSFGMNQAGEWVVSDVGAVAKTGEFLRDENLEVLKDYSTFIFLNDVSEVSTIEMRNLSIQFQMMQYGAVGFPQDADIDADLLQDKMAWEYGKLFVKEHFTEEMKKDVEDMVEEIIETYEKRIDKQDWMSEETKAKAKKKLETMNVKIGYPDEWPEILEKYEVTPPSEGGLLLHNILEIQRVGMEGYSDKLNEPVDKTEWEMAPQVVNAYYTPYYNEIVFPAGILQEPLYSKDYSRARNYGGIGMVIGHEISHAFDDNGALYDENGNYNVWWQDEELEEFKRLQKDIINYYNDFEVYDGNYVNGKLTLSENTADLGAVQCITQIVGPDRGDLRDMYNQYARIWAQVDTKEFLLNILKTDVHSPAKARVNAVLSSTDGFYYAYGIKAGDGMYVPKEKRVGIW